MQQIIKILAAITFLMIFISCNEEILPPAPAPEFAIEGVTVPLRLNVAKPRDYNIAFRVTHPEGVGVIETVTLTFYGSDQTTQLLQLSLYDDGGFLNDDHDIVAGDGIFTNHFISDSLLFPLGDVFMKVRAVDNAQSSTQTDLIGALALLNAAPKVLSAAVPDTLFSGSQLLLFSVAVQDSNDIEDVTAVVMLLKRGSNEIASYNLEFQSKTAPDSGIFGAFFDSTFAAERDSLYTLEFQAADLSDDVSDVLTKPIYLENIAPRLFNPILPDTLIRQTGNLLVHISVSDPQGLSDVDSVYFQSLKPDSTLGGGGFKFPLFDDGDPSNGDPEAGDGQFSWIVPIPSDADLGTYTFIFHSRDKVGNLSETVRKSFVLIP